MIASLYNFEHYSKNRSKFISIDNCKFKKMSVTKKGAVSPPPPFLHYAPHYMFVPDIYPKYTYLRIPYIVEKEFVN